MTEQESFQQQLASLAKKTFFVRDIEVSHRPIIGWALNDRLKPEILTKQILSFKAMGYGGLMIIPWRALPYEIMSSEWLEMVAHILRIAKKEYLEVWIWDDWIFPSGAAGGLVSGYSDDFKSKVLRLAVDIVLEPGEAIEMRVPDRTLASAVFPVDKFNNPCGEFTPLSAEAGQLISYKAKKRERLVIARWQMISAMQHTPKSHFENKDIYSDDDHTVFSVDMLNPEATKRFIEVIHQRYFDEFSEYFGNTLKGFFYDEPGLVNTAPWSSRVAEEFLKRKGYDLLEKLIPMLVEIKMYDVVFDLQSEEVKRVRADYMDVWTSLVAESFFAPLQEWCSNHSVICSGHLGGDSSLKEMLINSGHYFKDIDESDLPGVDIVFNQLVLGEFYDAPRLTGSRATVLGRGGSLSESFAATGHGMDIDTMRFTCDHQVARGINKFLTKLANYNPESDFYFHPPELSDANLMMRNYGHHLIARMGNLCALMSSGTISDRVALMVPMENYYFGESRMADEINMLAMNLAYNQRGFDYVWDEDLRNMSADDGCLVSKGGQRFSHLLLPPGTKLSTAGTQMIETLAKQGCQVIAFDEAPAGLEHFCQRIDTVAQLLTVTEDTTRPFEICNGMTPVSLSHRILSESRDIVFLLNESVDEQSLNISAKKGRYIYEIEPESLAVTSFGSTGNICLCLQPGESRLLLLDSSGDITLDRVPGIDVGSMLKLEEWELELPSGELAKLSEPLPSWNDLGYSVFHGSMRYMTAFTWSANTSDAELSLGDLRYAATVFLDGQPAGDCIFTPFTLSLHGLLPGEHRLEIEVLNTRANLVFGSEEQTRRLEESGVLRGTYTPVIKSRDKAKIISGLLGPVTITPVIRDLAKGINQVGD